VEFTFTKAVDSVEFPAELYLGQYSLSLLHFVFGFPVRTNDTRYFCIMTCGDESVELLWRKGGLLR
jgi:hypothetical protein